MPKGTNRTPRHKSSAGMVLRMFFLINLPSVNELSMNYGIGYVLAGSFFSIIENVYNTIFSLTYLGHNVKRNDGNL